MWEFLTLRHINQGVMTLHNKRGVPFLITLEATSPSKQGVATHCSKQEEELILHNKQYEELLMLCINTLLLVLILWFLAVCVSFRVCCPNMF